MKARRFSVLVAVDDSPEARAAVIATLAFPWSESARVSGVVALQAFKTRGRPVYVREAFERAYRRVATSSQQALRRRWPRALVAVVDQAPTEGILAEAGRRKPDVIVVGSRRRGWAVRMLLGSVSRSIVHQAACSVLVVRGRPHAFRRIVVGVDGSPHSNRAVELLGRLSPPAGGRIVLVATAEPAAIPSLPSMLRSMRADLDAALARDNRQAVARLRRELRPLERSLQRAGWTTRTQVVVARPLAALLGAVAKTRADTLVVGARGASGVERLRVGSVAEGVLDRCPVSVVVAR